MLTAGCFAIVLGFLLYSYHRTQNQSPTHAAAERVSALDRDSSAAPSDAKGLGEPLTAVDRNAPLAFPAEIPDENQVSDSTSQFDGTDSLPDKTADPITLRRQKVQAHLEFGEFGAALDVAESSADALERTELLRLVARAQLKAGEFDAALTSIRRIPLPEQRTRARGERVAQQTLAGGSGADPGALMNLIIAETSGPWEEVDGEGGIMEFFDTGVRVNPRGVLAALSQKEQTARLTELGVSARNAELNHDMAQPSTLRLVSLTRLENEIAKRLANGEPIVETMKRLAGLSQIRYLFVFQQEREIVIGGPAEGWRYNENGVPVGIDSGKPTLQLDDLVTLLRTFAPGGSDTFGCSINPRQEGLKRLMDYAAESRARGSLRAGAQVRNWVRMLQKQLGMQDIVLDGIPDHSRVARVIVEADYRMKLIGLGQLDSGSHIPSYFELLSVAEQKQAKSDVLRWWLSMKYGAVVHSPDRNVFEIQDASVLCQSTNQFVTSQGIQIDTGQAETTNRLFAQTFTNHYAELARRDTIFADLQNIFDTALVAALLRHERITDRMGWDLGVFAPGGAYRPAQFTAPREVDSVVDHRVYRGHEVVVQVAGGVRANMAALVADKSLMKKSERLHHFADKGRPDQLPEGRWWWDVAE